MKIDIKNKDLIEIGKIADLKGFEIYLVGGYVRDMLLNKECMDIDILVIGSGIEFAKTVAKSFGNLEIAFYERFGTAMIKCRNSKIEFVGARRESYSPESRNPDVSPGSLTDDLSRRDFTINALAVSLLSRNFGELIDLFNGLIDLKEGLIRTPLEPEKTFMDDPLRMLRAIRFSSTLGFNIDKVTFEGIKTSCERINIISQERITDEIQKILMSSKPSNGFRLLSETGLLNIIFPEIANLSIPNSISDGDERKEFHHKDVFLHTLQVLDNIAFESNNLWLRFAGLVHDIGKPKTRLFVKGEGWTFHGHEETGAKMIPEIFKRMRLPFDKIEYIQNLVRLHLRPIALVDEEVTDSAIRRLIFESGDNIEDLMTLCRADITSRNMEKVEKFKRNFEFVEKRIEEVEEKDKIRNFQPQIKGDEIMSIFNLSPGPIIGKLKNALVDAILDGAIKNDREESIMFLKKEFERLNH
jgi:poly(A) polymerase